MNPTIGHCVPSYAKYGGGYYCYITGLPTFFAKTIRVANGYFKNHGVDMVRL